MKPTAVQKFRLGIFVTLSLAVFLVAVYFIGEKRNMFGSTVHLFATFSNVNGLQPGNSVRYSGINIGTVQSMEMCTDTSIRIDMAIDRKILKHIRQDAVATIGSDGLVGSMIVNILPGQGKSRVVAPGAEINTYSRIRTEDLLKTLNVTNENAALLTVDLLKITKEITRGKGSIGTLLNDQGMASDMKEAIGNIRMASGSATRTFHQLEVLSGHLNRDDSAIGFLNDTDTAERLNIILSNLENTSAALDSAANNTNSLIRNAKNGKGAINYLSNNPGAVQKIDSILYRLDTATRLLNEDLEAAQHSFLLKGYFKKKAKRKE